MTESVITFTNSRMTVFKKKKKQQNKLNKNEKEPETCDYL